MLDHRQRQWLKRVFDVGSAVPAGNVDGADDPVTRRVLSRLERLEPSLQ